MKMKANYGHSRGITHKHPRGRKPSERFANAPKPKWDPHRYISDERFVRNMQDLVQAYAIMMGTAKSNHGWVFAQKKRTRNTGQEYIESCEEEPKEGKYTPIIYS